MKPTNASSGSSTLALRNAESADLPTEPVLTKRFSNGHVVSLKCSRKGILGKDNDENRVF